MVNHGDRFRPLKLWGPLPIGLVLALALTTEVSPGPDPTVESGYCSTIRSSWEPFKFLREGWGTIQETSHKKVSANG